MKNQPEIEELIDAYVDGSMNEEEATALLHYAEETPSVLDTLHRQLTVNEMLKEASRGLETMAPLAKFVADINKEQTDRRRFWLGTLSVLASCMLLLWCVVLLRSFDLRSTHFSPSEPQNMAYQATVTGLSDPVWAKEPQWNDVGLTVQSNRYRMKSGKFAVQFSNDVQMAFSGLVDLLVDSPLRIECFSGKASFDVSPQSADQPFEVRIPQGTVIVTGTKFSVDSDKLISEVHVEEGSVRFEPNNHGSVPISLRAGEALSVSRTKEIRQFSSDSSLYLSSDQMPIQPLKQLRQWEQRGREIDIDPYLVARFAFIREPMQNIANTSEFGAVEIPFGKANRYRWTQGRFIGKWGVRLDSDRETISFSSVKTPRTFSVVLGIHVECLPEISRSLFVSDFISCTINPEGGIGFSSKDIAAVSSVVWDGEMLEKWIMLVMVFDERTQTIAVYVNGRIFEVIPFAPSQELPETPSSETPLLPFGRICLGPFPGAIDEFMLFERRLSEDEIREIF